MKGGKRAREIAQAARLFARFHGREVQPGEIVAIDSAPATALEIGQLAGIIYVAKGDGKKYIHQFKTRRPVLYASADGSQVYIVAGRYRFTDRGFVDPKT